ncbi:hypothetical protein V1504DRAFT_461201 [Lipomyces starkeyi]
MFKPSCHNENAVRVDIVLWVTSHAIGARPWLDVHERIVANVNRLIRSRSLLIIAYIDIDAESNRLQLISQDRSQKLLWSMIHEPFLATTDDSAQSLDVLAVLDCCYYAGSAVRAGGNRSVQLVAPGDDHSTVRPRKDGRAMQDTPWCRATSCGLRLIRVTCYTDITISSGLTANCSLRRIVTVLDRQGMDTWRDLDISG